MSIQYYLTYITFEKFKITRESNILSLNPLNKQKWKNITFSLKSYFVFIVGARSGDEGNQRSL